MVEEGHRAPAPPGRREPTRGGRVPGATTTLPGAREKAQRVPGGLSRCRPVPPTTTTHRRRRGPCGRSECHHVFCGRGVGVSRCQPSRSEKRYLVFRFDEKTHAATLWTCAAPCCTMQHMNKTLSSPKKQRVSVPVTPDLLATFERMGKATNMGTGAAIAEWLSDTHEAAELMASLLERARQSPKQVMREMHAYALGLADETGEVLRKVSAKGVSGAVGNAARQVLTEDPPSCNTGGKVPQTGGKVHKKRKTTTSQPPVQKNENHSGDGN